MNILITGACGHIGSYLVENLHKIKKVRKAFLIDSLESTNNIFSLDQKKDLLEVMTDLNAKAGQTEITEITVLQKKIHSHSTKITITIIT